MRKYYFPLVVGVVLLMVVGFLFFLGFLVATWRPGDYYFYGDAPHTLFLQKEISLIPLTVLRWLLFIITAGLVLAVALTSILELVRWELDRRHGIIRPLEPGNDESRLIRFNTHQVLQHYMIMGSVIAVGLVGLPQAFPNWSVAQWWINEVWGGLETARLFHHRIGYLVDFTIFYHFGYLAYHAWVKKDASKAMLPRLKDVKDFLHNYLYIFGIAKEEPQYERYSYGQKIDYWFLLMCLPLLSITGLVMYHTAITGRFLPAWAIASAAVLHRSLALLVAWFILIVHIYYGHLAPQVFPINRVILTGTMPEKQYKELYALDYARRKASQFQVAGNEQNRRS